MAADSSPETMWPEEVIHFSGAERKELSTQHPVSRENIPYESKGFYSQIKKKK